MAGKLALHGGTAVRDRPWSDWPEFGAPEREALARVLDSRSWGGFPSPNTEAAAFEAEFGAYVGARHVALCANGTFSLTLTLQAARVAPGAEVVTTAYSFVGTPGAIVGAGCVPVFVDVDPDSYCIDPEQVEAAITPRTEALMPVHLACSMADLDRLGEIAERRGLLLVEDCAHAHGARWRDRGAGSVGDFGSFSMQSTKLLTAGEGGAVTTSDDVYAQRLHSLVNCGRKEPEYRDFPEQMLGHNLRITEWQAAVLRCQLERLPEQHARRTARIARFEDGVCDLPGFSTLPHDPRVTRRTAYQFILRYDARALSGVPRDTVIQALQAEGVRCFGQFYLPLNEDPLFSPDPHTNAAARAGADWSEQVYPVTRRAAYDEAIWLPHELFLGSDADVDDLLTALAKVHENAAELRDPAAAAPAAG
ncbi:MAG: DegT/DnrJ/EryC1/StrS family aminotransferase [Deltaproteobacteria bacterium]|nr:DegT/DnrJ/EryC1/StrS family aminotransferase [Deltaproteobacteria bacterium]